MLKSGLSLLAFVVFALWARGWWACNIHDLPDSPFKERWCCADNEKVMASTTSTRPKTLALIENGAEVLTGFEQFHYELDSHGPVLTSNNQGFLKAVASHLNFHPGQKVLITGHYGASEKASSTAFFENIGIARAASVRDILVKDYGVEQSSILLDGSPVDESPPLIPLTFNIGGKASASVANYEFTDMTFSDANFESNSAKLIPTPQFVRYVDSLVVHCKNNDKLSLTIIGHTDSDGDDELNKKLGLKRAEATKAYLRKRGIKNKCLPISKGEKEPAADNDTEEGKAKNRRINIKVK